MPNYDQETKHLHSSINKFEEATALPEGIHQIQIPGELTLEILIRGKLNTIPAGMKIPLFMPGWVTKRTTKTGPFFSGEGISRTIGTPFFSISDPVVNENNHVGLGWFLGTQKSPVMVMVRRAVKKIASLLERKILAIGGSGGGFASLSLAAQNPDVTAFVWNPQTRVVEALPANVRAYMEGIFGGDWSDNRKDDAADLLTAAGFTHDLTEIPAAENFLYLQNSTDYQIVNHYVPFLKAHGLTFEGNGRYSAGPNRTVQMGNFSHQHQAPSRELIQDAITLLQPDDATTGGVLSVLEEKGYLDGTDFEISPADLRNDVEFLDDLRMEFSTEDGKTFYCHVIHPAEKVKPLKYQFHGMRDDQKQGSSSKNTRTLWYWIRHTVNRIDCDIWDGFDHYIGTISRDFNLDDYAGKPGASSDQEAQLKQ